MSAQVHATSLLPWSTPSRAGPVSVRPPRHLPGYTAGHPGHHAVSTSAFQHTRVCKGNMCFCECAKTRLLPVSRCSLRFHPKYKRSRHVHEGEHERRVCTRELTLVTRAGLPETVREHGPVPAGCTRAPH